MKRSEEQRKPETFARALADPEARMTPDQAVLLHAFSQEANTPYVTDLTQLEAHERIIALRDFIASNAAAAQARRQKKSRERGEETRERDL